MFLQSYIGRMSGVMRWPQPDKLWLRLGASDGWYLYEGGSVTVMHGSQWKYDTHVPIIFAGAGLQPKRVHRPVHPADVEPTLAVILGTNFPSAADGQPLVEALQP